MKKKYMSFKESVKGVVKDKGSEKHASMQTEVFLSVRFMYEI